MKWLKVIILFLRKILIVPNHVPKINILELFPKYIPQIFWNK